MLQDDLALLCEDLILVYEVGITIDPSHMAGLELLSVGSIHLANAGTRPGRSGETAYNEVITKQAG